jgi:hypothetical protein
MTTTIEWIDPPKRCRGAYIRNYGRFITELKHKPGEWARVDNQPERGSMATNAYAIKQGRIKSFGPAGTFDAVSRKEEDGTHSLYVKYLGRNK